MVDNKFVLNIIRMTDEELLEYLVGEAEARAIYIYQNDIIDEDTWEKIDARTDKIETIKAELLRRM
jgi:hypothetical protein